MSTLVSVLITVACLVTGVFVGVTTCVKLSTLGERRHDQIEHREHGRSVTISWDGVSAPYE